MGRRARGRRLVRRVAGSCGAGAAGARANVNCAIKGAGSAAVRLAARARGAGAVARDDFTSHSDVKSTRAAPDALRLAPDSDTAARLPLETELALRRVERRGRLRCRTQLQRRGRTPARPGHRIPRCNAVPAARAPHARAAADEPNRPPSQAPFAGTAERARRCRRRSARLPFTGAVRRRRRIPPPPPHSPPSQAPFAGTQNPPAHAAATASAPGAPRARAATGATQRPAGLRRRPAPPDRPATRARGLPDAATRPPAPRPRAAPRPARHCPIEPARACPA